MVERAAGLERRSLTDFASRPSPKRRDRQSLVIRRSFYPRAIGKRSLMP
jgi:hypothetical protein